MGSFSVSSKISAIITGLLLLACVADGQTNRGTLSVLLLLNNEGGSSNTADGTAALFNDNYSRTIGDEDSYKFPNQDENIAINRGGILLSIEGRPGIVETDTLPLRVYNYRQTSYILKLQASSFADSLTAVVKDAWLNTETTINLTGVTSIPFNVSTSDASSANNRFSIVFRTLKVPVAITAQPQNAVACRNGNTVLTAAAKGFYITWQWQVSTNGGTSYSNITDGSVYSSSTTNTLAINNVTASLVNNLYRVIVAGVSPVSADTSAAASIAIANTWMGTNGTDWNNGTNWACSIVPSVTDDVVIPVSANSPGLTSASTIGNLVIKPAASIALSGQVLTVNSNVSGSGFITGSSASGLVLNGSGGETVYFNTASDTTTNVLKSLTINRSGGSVTLGNRLYISDALTATNGTLNTGGFLTIRSTSITTTARVAPVGGTISGDVTVERFIPARRAYRFISPSVTTTGSIKANWMENQNNTTPANNSNNVPGFGTHITGSAGAGGGFDATATNAPSLFSFDNNTQAYKAVLSTSGTLTAGVSLRLFVRGDRSINLQLNNPPATPTILRATGALKQGNVTLNTTSTPALSATNGNFNLVGNPYASDVSWLSLYNASSGLSSSYYILDPNQSNGKGVFVNFNTSGVRNNESSEISDNIQSGQGFFVQTTAPSPTLVFAENQKTAGPNTNVFKQADDLTKLSVQLLFDSTGGSGNNADGVNAVFDEQFSPYIGTEDALKIVNRDENLAINHNGTPLSIEGLPAVKGTDTVHIKLWQYRRNSYYLKFDPANWPANTTSFLTDAYLHSEEAIDLSASSLKHITITTDSASAASDRFSIIFKSSAATLPVTVTNVTALTKGRGIQVDWISQTEVNIDRYEIEKSVNGQLFEKVTVIKAKGDNAVADNYTWFDENPVTGTNYYRIKVIEKSGAVAYTQIVKATISKIGSSITVYPNPVKGNIISLHFANMDKGRYTVTLYNNLGQKMYITLVEHTGLSATYPVKPGKVLSKGTYRLHVAKGDKIMNTMLVFE